MSTDYFIKLCAKAKIPVPNKDADVRKLLTDSGATVLDAKTASASKLRKEHAAAVLWARANIDKDGAWKKFPDEARDTIIALFPIKQSVIDKGGLAWTNPCRALIRVYGSPPPSPKVAPKAKQVNKGSRAVEGSDSTPEGSSSEESEPPKKKAKVQGKSAEGAKQGSKEIVAPYLPTPALLAILPLHRRAQLYLGDTWSTKTKADREKQLERLMSKTEYGGRFEDPDSPAWSQRISIRRGPGSSFSDDDIKQDGKNLAHMLRWDSAQLLFSNHDYDGIHRLQTRATRVRVAWDRFIANGRDRVAPSTAILATIFRAIHEVLDQRLTSATGELCDAGAAGEEILADMARQKEEASALFLVYEHFLTTLYASATLDYGLATRRANSVWYGLLQPSVAVLTQDVSIAERDGLESIAELAFSGSSPPKKPKSEEEGSPSGGAGAGGSGTPAPPPAIAPMGGTILPQAPWGAWPGMPAGGYSYAFPPPGTVPQTMPQPPPPAYAPPASPGPASGNQKGQPNTPPTVDKNKPNFHIPVSVGIVGTSRGTVTTPRRGCSRGTCSLQEPHFAWECPVRMAATIGEAPPGFTASGAKDPAAWSGADITPATARAWKTYLAAHPEITKSTVAWVTNFD